MKIPNFLNAFSRAIVDRIETGKVSMGRGPDSGPAGRAHRMPTRPGMPPAA